jgi:TonB family protein
MRWARLFVPVLVAALSSVRAGAASPQISSSEAIGSGLPAGKGVMPTRPGLQLTLRADCGKVQILTDALDEVRYIVRPHARPDRQPNAKPNSQNDPQLDSPIAAADAPVFLQGLSLTANDTPRGVVLTSSVRTEADCRGDLIYEIHVPRRYHLDVALQYGDIVTQDIDGLIVLFTGGGDIRVGRVGTSAAGTKGVGDHALAAQLETAGGDISVGDVTGGLRATTGGGLITAGDVRGSAVLRSGGGDVRIGHVFGAVRLTSAGGNITAKRVDGGVWADTAGGRVEIGDVTQRPAIAPKPSQLSNHGEAMPVLGDLAGFTDFARVFDAILWGGIRVDPTEQQKRLLSSVAPVYPDVAQLAGIEGDVTLRILVTRDGTVGDVSPVAGRPVLARAAMRAVEQWRYVPTLVQGYPVDVVTTVTLAFRLR